MSESLDRVTTVTEPSLAELYERYASWLKTRLARRYGLQAAEDLSQETWLRLAPYQAAEAIRHPKALLLRIASNLEADRRARRSHRVRHAAEVSRSHGWGYELPAQTDEMLLKQLVLDLPEPLRTVFVLSRFGGLTHSQIGERLGISPKSAYQTAARSSAGAVGLTQLMPGTALEMGVRDRLDPVENLNGGADYLARQIRRFGDLRLALAAYHAGPARVARLGRIPDSTITQAYVATVVDCYLALAAGRRVISARQCRSPGAG